MTTRNWAEVVTTIAELDAVLTPARRTGRRIGLVPTLGALHAGHVSLIDAAHRENDLVVVSVFLNPTQFDDAVDLERYPSDPDADRAAAQGAGADVIFCPGVEEIYPAGEPLVTVDPGWMGGVLEGASRPGHYRAVATVVAKLFAIASATRTYFGEKDYQQLVILRRLALDLSIATEVVAVPTVREADGLAVSSRNVFLAPSERPAAATLHRALLAGAGAVAGGTADVEKEMRATIAAEPLVELDYAVVVGDGGLEPPSESDVRLRLLIAARLGKVRLIDNLVVAR